MVDYAVGIVLAGYGVQLCPSELQWLVLVSFLILYIGTVLNPMSKAFGTVVSFPKSPTYCLCRKKNEAHYRGTEGDHRS